jgi:flagellar biogenesis protein FliO
MTLSRQPIRVLSATLLASALYASPGRAQLPATSEPYAEEPAVAPKAAIAPKFVVKPKAVAKPKAAVAPEPVVAPPEAVLDSEPVPVPAPKAAAKPEPAKAAGDRHWLRTKAPQSVASAAPVTSPWRLVALGAVVLGLGGAALFQRRRRTSFARAVRSDLTLLSTVRVGNKAQVVVVNVGGRKLLLGVTEAEVSRLGWLEGELDLANAELEVEQEPFAFPSRGALSDGELFAPGVLPAEPRPAAATAPQAEPPRRFRELLFNALGQETRPATRATAAKAKAPLSAAEEIAEGMRDVVSRAPGSRVASPAGAPEMVDIEGQARGLVLRLQKRA